MKTNLLYSLLVFVLIQSSCRVYRQDIMLQVKEETQKLKETEAERTYIIQHFDLLDVSVYTNNGERLVDPNAMLMRELAAGGSGGGGIGMQNMNLQNRPQYMVQENGEARLPMVGNIALAGLSLHQADSILAIAYSTYYKEPFVITRFLNKRVIVLGAAGGQVIPLENNQHVNLLEVLALAGGFEGTGKAHNIRLIRGNLDDPQVQIIDLSTIEGMRMASLQVQSGDIIYVEPIRRILPETIRDIGPVLGLVSSLITFTLFVITLGNNN
ncbi:polysaccharide biosynthesis/export family protein [Cesiribacter andamanensis]|uniref:Polysaccharide export protein EpsE n=1 Tax=Cesiribacter andamanensis AMV16 TaxID=1279009 RepID=M7N2E9_9BACT|nr:polysaccharide biosynthesis/export family protein [Cesiribacter andamanensis]EMR02838.1 polysaccharide export protein EpsE [Cesiribacter andamanensis AMV16]